MDDDRALPAGSEILVVDDDAPLRRRLAAYLERQGASVSLACRREEARRLLKETRPDFVLLDVHLPDGEGLALLRDGEFSSTTAVIVMTAFGSVEKAVTAMRLGAADYLTKPFELPELPLAFGRCRKDRHERRRAEHASAEAARNRPTFYFGPGLAELEQQLRSILATDHRLAPTSAPPPVLLEGETGTGKSLLARWIHDEGPRRSAPFVALNCATLPDTLAEAELFGHERGAFTDARQSRLGLFEAADGGTLFLDEISSLNLGVQAKLLTVLEDGRVRRVGATRDIPVNVRVIAASNQPLQALIERGAFRPDLWHRLRLLVLRLPTLRERGRDVLALARHLLAALARRHQRPGVGLSSQAETRILQHGWPGNVRELAHELERALIFEAGPKLELTGLMTRSAPAPANGAEWRNPNWKLPEQGFVLDTVIADLIAEALRETGDNVSAAARRLGVTRDFLRYRLAQTPSENSAG